MTTPPYALTLTPDQARQLLRLVGIGELTMSEHLQHGWLPKLSGDAALMRTYLKEHASGPSLELLFRQLRTWLREEEKGGKMR